MLQDMTLHARPCVLGVVEGVGCYIFRGAWVRVEGWLACFGVGSFRRLCRLLPLYKVFCGRCRMLPLYRGFLGEMQKAPFV